MSLEQELRERLRKVEALFAGAGTPGERAAAGAARERIMARLREAQLRAHPIEMRFSIADPWSRQLFVALARRYGLRPYRRARQRRATVMLSVPPPFLDQVLWPEYQTLNAALIGYLAAATNKVIREAVHGGPPEPDERP
jgi:hypothetical protein